MAAPETVAKCVEAIGGWRYLQTSEELMTDRSHFVKAYEQLSKREAVQAQLPPQLRAGNNPALASMRQLTKELGEKNDYKCDSRNPKSGRGLDFEPV